MAFRFQARIDSKSFYGTKRMYEKLCKEEAARRVKRAGQYYLKKTKENASVTNYSLGELRRRDHPYARRHGRIAYRKIPPLRRFQIHERSGDFKKSIRGRFNAQTRSYTLFLQGAPEYAFYLVKGSKYMLPRDIFAGTLNIEKTEMRKIILGKK